MNNSKKQKLYRFMSIVLSLPANIPNGLFVGCFRASAHQTNVNIQITRIRHEYFCIVCVRVCVWWLFFCLNARAIAQLCLCCVWTVFQGIQYARAHSVFAHAVGHFRESFSFLICVGEQIFDILLLLGRQTCAFI